MRKFPWFWIWTGLLVLTIGRALWRHHWFESYLWMIVVLQACVIRSLEHAREHRAGGRTQRGEVVVWTCSEHGCIHTPWTEAR